MHNKKLACGLLTIAALAFALGGAPQTVYAATGPICYVDANAAGGGDGNAWLTAFNDLQAALADSACTQIWVADGIYKPTTGSDRTISFVLENGIGIYGGFNGSETHFDDRDWTTNVATLSGDIGAEGDHQDNSYHVVISPNGADSSAVLNGFTITAGDAFGVSDFERKGGGIYNDQGNPTLANLNLSVNGALDGAGMYNNSGSPHLTNVTFGSNVAGLGSGGGLFNDHGSPVLQNVTFNYNTARDGGGMYSLGGQPSLTTVIFNGNEARRGGGMHNEESNPSLTDATFSSNRARASSTGEAQGGGMYNHGSDPTLLNVTFTGNWAVGSASWEGNGGGMYNAASNPTLTTVNFINNATPAFSEGQANIGGGMFNTDSNVTLTDVTFSGNTATQGAGMSNFGGIQTLTHVSFSNNTATSWVGGMGNFSSTVALTDVTFTGNSAQAGGGIYNHQGSQSLDDVTFNGNMATGGTGWGGGMFNVCASPTLMNVTFTSNEASDAGGGVTNYTDTGCLPSAPSLTNVTFNDNQAPLGGGIYNSMSNPTLIHVTMAGNTAVSGPALANGSGSPLIYNSIFWESGAMPEIWYPSVPATFTIINSIIESGCPAPSPTVCTNVSTGDPLLGSLANNGGLTETMALGAGSAALDTADDTYCPAADQRGVSRPQGAACDMGAYELAVNHAPVITEGASVSVSTTETGFPNPLDLTLHATDADLDTLTWSIGTPPSHGSVSVSGTGLSKAILYFPVAAYNGSDSCVVGVDDGAGGSDSIVVNLTVHQVAPHPQLPINGPAMFPADVEGPALTAQEASSAPEPPTYTQSAGTETGASITAPTATPTVTTAAVRSLPHPGLFRILLPSQQ